MGISATRASTSRRTTPKPLTKITKRVKGSGRGFVRTSITQPDTPRPKKKLGLKRRLTESPALTGVQTMSPARKVPISVLLDEKEREIVDFLTESAVQAAADEEPMPVTPGIERLLDAVRRHVVTYYEVTGGAQPMRFAETHVIQPDDRWALEHLSAVKLALAADEYSLHHAMDLEEPDAAAESDSGLGGSQDTIVLPHPSDAESQPQTPCLTCDEEE